MSNEEHRIAFWFMMIFGCIIATSIALYAILSSTEQYPTYSFNKDHAKAIFYKYDLINNSKPHCNDQGCASINPIMAAAWKELCVTDGDCDGHDAFHYWYSSNPEVNKTKTLWNKLLKNNTKK